MKITILTNTEEVQRLKQLTATISIEFETSQEYKFYESYDDFIKEFPKDNSQAVIVARKGADGMECARNARLMRPTVPLVWLSDDEGFGPESYRIECAYFSAKAITEKLLSTAIERCRRKE